MRARLVLAFGLLLGLMMALTLLAVAALTQAHRGAAQLLDQGAYRIELAGDLRAQILMQTALVTRHVNAQSDAEKSQLSGQIGPLAAELDRKLALLAQLSSQPAADMLDRLRKLAGQSAERRALALDLSRQNSNARAAILSTNEMPAVRAGVIAALEALVAVLPPTPADLRQAADSIATEVNGIAADEKNAVLNPEDGYIARQLEAVARGRDRIQAQLGLLHHLPPAQTSRVDAALTVFRTLDTRIEALVRANTASHASDLLSGGLADLDAQMLDLVAGIAGLAQTQLAHAEDEANADFFAARLTLVLLADLALAVGVALALLCAVSLGRGLDQVCVAAERLAQGGDINLDGAAGGAAGRLAQALSRIAQVQQDVADLAYAVAAGDLSQQGLVAQGPEAQGLARQDGDRLGQALAAMLTALGQVSVAKDRRVAQHAEQSLRLRPALHAARADAQQVADGSEEAVVLVDALAQRLVQAAEAGPRTPDILRQIEGGVLQASAALKTAGDPLQISRVLHDFAQTVDFLSVSAAVEASRAGAQGAGFAIVAAELRRLAERGHAVSQDIAAQAEPAVSKAKLAQTQIETILPAVLKLTAALATARASLRDTAAQAERQADHFHRQTLVSLRCLTSIAAAEVQTGRMVEDMARIAGDGGARALAPPEQDGHLIEVAPDPDATLVLYQPNGALFFRRRGEIPIAPPAQAALG